MHSWAIETIDCIYREKFQIAEETARKIINHYPDHPAGYFFMAIVLDSWMARYRTDKKENEFYTYCDKAIEKGENHLDKDPHNQWVRFFIGGADGYKGTYEARYERWITAFRYGWKGVSLLLDLESSGSDIVDLHYGIGNYNYWRSAMMKSLWWMPGVEDKRDEAIQQLYKVRKNGIYTKTAASVSLIEILLNEKRHKETLEIASEMLKIYPNALAFHQGKAKALFGLGQWGQAQKAFRTILQTVDNDPLNNHYNSTICRLWLARIYVNQKQYSKAAEECKRVEDYKYSKDIKKRLEKEFAEIKTIKKDALNK